MPVTLTLRSVKGSPLTNTEMDTNLSNIKALVESLEGSALTLAGPGVAATAAKSDHLHTGVYAADAHTHSGVYAPASHTHPTTDVFANGSSSGDLLTWNGSAWGAAAPASTGAPTGAVFDYVGGSAPTGYVLLSGRSIGNGSSNATERANTDTLALFALLWNSTTNAECQLLDSSVPGVNVTRGVDAATDFAANRKLVLPDARGRVIAGRDDMGGTAANRLTAGGSGITGTTLGASGGTQTHALSIAELASHTHTVNYYPDGSPGASGLGSGVDLDAGGPSTQPTNAAGSGTAHQNTQPTLVLNKIIKL